MNEQLDIILTPLRQRPAMYIGRYSIIRLRAFLDGYFEAIRLRDHNPHLMRTMSGFTSWLASKYCITGVLGWDTILLRQTNDDDEAAFHLFWEKWDEYCREKDTD